MEQPQQQDYRIYLLSRKPFDPSKESAPPEPVEAAWYVVQFVKPLTFDEQKLLRTNYDLRLTDYLPNFAFLEWLTPEAWRALTQDKLYRASVLYKASDKISPRILTSADAHHRPALLLCAVLFPAANLDDFLKELKALLPRVHLTRGGCLCSFLKKLKALLRLTKSRQHGMGETRAADTLSTTDTGYSGHEPGTEQIRVFDDRAYGGDLQVIFPSLPREQLLAIAKLKEVRWIEEEPEVTLDSAATVVREGTPGGLIQSGHVNITPVWDKGIQGQEQIIGVTDHAINPEHCMFFDSNPIGPTHRKLRGRRQRRFKNTFLNRTTPHGHRVAALAAGHDMSGSLNYIRGMAWEAKLSLDDLDDLMDRLINVSQTLRNQTADGAFIHSNSWHIGCGYNQKAVDVDNFVFNNERHFVCGSAGNSGDDEECIGPPGSAKNALSVSASKNARHEMEFGDGVVGPISDLDRRLKPDICAPGCDLNTASRSGCNAQEIDCASSWATPIIAGAAALVRQFYLEGWYPTGTRSGTDSHDPSGALIKATLLNSTVDMTSVLGYPSYTEGWGLLRLTNTLFFADASAPRLFVQDISNAIGLHTDEFHTYEIAVKDDSRPLKVTLVWSDDATTLPAAKPLVNDLNLIVISPDNKTFLGNHFDANGLSTEGGEADAINNVEMVIRNQQLQGTWRITVRCAAANGTTKTQGYALVVTAAL
jgi:hypothetical protein